MQAGQIKEIFNTLDTTKERFGDTRFVDTTIKGVPLWPLLRNLIYSNDVSVTIAEWPDDGVSGMGFVIMRSIKNESEIIMLCVKPEHRREGLATLLMIDVIDKAITSGVKHIFLEVSEDNYKAKSMYKKLGFKNVGTRKKYYN